MAPRKRRSRAADGEGAATSEPQTNTNSLPLPVRATRISTRGLKAYSTAESPNQKQISNMKKKARTTSTKEGKADKTSKVDNEEEEGPPPAEVSDECYKTRTIVIEHCKQCNSFKTRATIVKDGLENSVPGITVLVNPEKPRRGCFEVREEGGEKFITLLDMKRPFAPMKALDMDQVISDIVNKIK